MSSAPPKIFQRLVEPDGTANKVWYSWFSGLATATPAPATPVDLSGYLPNTTTAQGHGYIRHTGSLADGAVFFDLVSTYPGQTSITTLGTIATGTWNGTAIAAANGGTGQTSYTIGDLLYASGLTSLTRLAAGTATHVLTSNGAGVAPSWQAPAGNVAADTHAATSKTTPVDADEIPLADSAASFGLKKLTWANLKATLKTYLDTLYQAIHANLTALSGLTGAADKLAYFTGLGTMALTAFPSFGRSLVGSADGPAARVLLGITSGGALSASSQATQKWDYYEHGIATSAATGASYVINGSVPVGYLSNGNLTLVAGEAGHPGIALTQTGNSAGGYLRVAYTPGNVVCVGGGEWRFVDVRRIPVLSNAAQRFQITYGLYNGITGVTRLIDMICKDDINGGAWQGRCIDAGGTTTVNGTTVPVANSWPKLEIVVNAAGTSVEFFVDSVSQGVITTNIPTDSMCLFAQINKTVGATTSLQHLDYAEMTQTFTTPR